MTKYAVTGGAAYLAARFVFDASNTKSLWVAGIAVAVLWGSLQIPTGK